VTVKTVKTIEVFQRFFPLAAAQLESSCIPHYPPYERGRTSGTQGIPFITVGKLMGCKIRY
jgi:hypothetical protein